MGVLSASVRWIVPATAVMCLVGPFASAADGIIEINSARALAGGVTPGDGPGYPVTLDTEGSYRLTGNLYTRASHRTAIEITADRVTLDLNGFTIACAAPGEYCAPTGSTGRGVSAARQPDFTVRNGTIRSMQAAAIAAGDRARIESIRSISNGKGPDPAESGIVAGSHSVVSGCSVTDSGSHGIEVGDYASVVGCSVTANASSGISAGNASSIRENDVRLNTSAGIRLGGHAAANQVCENNEIGIACYDDCFVERNLVCRNGSSGIYGFGGFQHVVGNQVIDNQGTGIYVFWGSVLENIVARNKSLGLVTTNIPTMYGANEFTNNNGGNANPQVGTLPPMIESATNVCGDDTTCP